MSDLAAFLVLAAALVAASTYWLVRPGLNRIERAGVSQTTRRAPSTGLLIVIPLSVAVLYARLGNLAAVTPAPADPVRALAEQRTAVLAERLATSHDDVPGLRLLARSYEQLGRTRQAIETRERLVALHPDDPDALVDLADALATAQGGSYIGEPIASVRRALAIDAGNGRALAALANEAVERDDLPTAIAAWERIATMVPADSALGRSLRADVDGATAALAARAQGSQGITTSPDGSGSRR